jgi:type IV pilus assembly protein PilQ
VQNGGVTSGTTATTSTPGATFAGGLERVEAGLQLGVLPSVVNGSMIRLVVDVNNSQPDSQIAVDGIPAVSTNSANTSVIVDNGATAVIAGLIKNSDSTSRSGVPFLSDIPVLGLLFRSDGKVEKNNEMIILITPRILDKQLSPEPEKTAVNEPAPADGGEKTPAGAKSE